MTFFEDIKTRMMALRGNIAERFISHPAAVKQLFDLYEDKARQRIAGLIGARDYRQYEGTLDAAQRAKLLRQVRSDISAGLKELLLMVGYNSLKDKLLPLLDSSKELVYQEETARLAEIYADLLPEGVKIALDISKVEQDALRQLPLAGLSIRDYIQKILIELYLGAIQAMVVKMIDAQTFEGGIRSGLAEVGGKFETARRRAAKLSSELIVQASNQAINDVNGSLRSIGVSR